MRNWRSGNDSVVTKTVLVSLKPSDWSPISPISQCETWCLLKLFIMPVQFPFYTMVVRKPMWCRREASTLGRCQCSATTQLKNARVDWCDCLWSQDQQILFEWNATSTFIQLVWSGNVFTADIKSSRHQETHFSKLRYVYSCSTAVHPCACQWLQSRAPRSLGGVPSPPRPSGFEPSREARSKHRAITTSLLVDNC